MTSLAQAEARRRAVLVNKAGDEIERGYHLIDERKAEEALAVFSAAYEALPNIPLAQEHRLAARNGYVVAGCLHAQELAAQGDLEAANKLLDTLLSPEVAPNDARVLALQKRLGDPDRFPPALTAKHVGSVQAVKALLIKANSFIEIGDPDKAILTYQEVLRIDPTNSTARRGMERAEQEKQRYYKAAYDHQRSKMLGEVDKSWEEQVPLSSLDVSAMFGASTESRGYTQSGRESITQKLRTLIFPQVDFAGATLDEVAELLRVRSSDLDPQGKGVSFVMNVPPESRDKPITLNLSNVPMEEVLRYVSEMSGVTYKVDDHAVIFVSLSERGSAVTTRTFRVPPDFIQNSPAGDPAATAPADPFGAQAPGGGGGLIIRRMGAKEFLEARGVAFPEGTSASFNNATSMLTVRNTLQNMDMVELLVEQATKSAPKLAVITVRMLEVNQTNLEELGFDWLLGGAGMNGNNVFVGGGNVGNGNGFNAASYPFSTPYTTPALFTGTPPVLVFPAIPTNGALAGPLPSGTIAPFPYGGGPITSGLRSGTYAAGASSLDSLLRTGSPLGNQSVAPGILSLAGVFTDPQFQSVLRGLSQKKGIDVNASPSVTTKNGLKATVEITREIIYPTEFDPPQLPQGQPAVQIIAAGATAEKMIATPTTPTAFEMRKTGVMLEVEPVISEDGRSVELTIAPELTEFEGFVNYGSPIFSPASQSVLPIQLTAGIPPGNTSYIPISQPEQLITPNMILQPVFKTQKVSTGVKIWDGATVVLGGAKIQRRTLVEDKLPILGDLPFVGRFFQSSVNQTETKNIIIFVTVDVVDPSGQKINRDTAAVSR
ncbi:Amuc_1098 family type IV pilus outer membrane protein [Prosthecobacter sp.]|uniref:Amuc_1098 family type IV pilus outer membrane protein n=1 Tax=Prosthecobacter sp. TaxID=1965333 RepID=UPI002AC8B94F|nr:Amuc_1098 family type IV pilus outer membrane protein [Prosthecobacter sp.]